MRFHIETARNPVRVTAHAIDLLVKFREMPAEVQFTAMETDSEFHGKTLYQNAVNGDYGTIEEGSQE